MEIIKDTTDNSKSGKLKRDTRPIRLRLKIKSWPIQSNLDSLKFFEAIEFLSFLKDPILEPPFQYNNDDKVWYQSQRGCKTKTFICEGTIETNVLTLLGLIKESDIGSLAGNLINWDNVSLNAFSHIVNYRSSLPWPLYSRSFSVRQIFAVDDKDILFIGFNSPNDYNYKLNKHNSVIGNCIFSFYRIKILSDNKCLLRRALNIDLHLMIPDKWLLAQYADRYLKDFEIIRKSCNRISNDLEMRLQTQAIYLKAKELISCDLIKSLTII